MENREVVIAVAAAHAAATDALAADRWDAHGANAAALSIYRDAGATEADMQAIMAEAGWDRMVARNAATGLRTPETDDQRAARVAAGEAMLATDRRHALEGADSARRVDTRQHDEESLSQTGQRLT